MRMRMAAIAAISIIAPFLVGPSAAQVPDPYASQLAQQLAHHEETLTAEGFERIAGPFSGGLARGEAQRFNVLLHAGAEYQIVAVCDVDCRNVDLRLYDQNRNPISADSVLGRTAAVTSQPRWTGPFIIEVRMTHCQNAPCYFAFNVYGR